MNDKNLMTTIMWGVACGIAVEKTASAAFGLIYDVIRVKLSKKEK